jgi:hypothetical protein
VKWRPIAHGLWRAHGISRRYSDMAILMSVRSNPRRLFTRTEFDSGVLLAGRQESLDPLGKPVLDGCEVCRHDSLQVRRFCVAPYLCLELPVIRLWQDEEHIVPVAGGLELRVPSGPVLFRKNVVVQLSPDRESRRAQPAKGGPGS